MCQQDYEETVRAIVAHIGNGSRIMPNGSRITVIYLVILMRIQLKYSSFTGPKCDKTWTAWSVCMIHCYSPVGSTFKCAQILLRRTSIHQPGRECRAVYCLLACYLATARLFGPPCLLRCLLLLQLDEARNSAIANRSWVSCARQVTTVLTWPSKVTQGHRFDRLRMIYHYRSIVTMVTMVLSCGVSHILVENREINTLRLRSEGLVWLIGTMMCLLAAPWVQLSVSAVNGWPHNALRHHWLMPISCHFLDCKALLVTSLTHVSGAITSV